MTTLKNNPSPTHEGWIEIFYKLFPEVKDYIRSEEIIVFITNLLSETRTQAFREVEEVAEGMIGKFAKAANVIDEKTAELVNELYDKALYDFIAALKTKK